MTNMKEYQLVRDAVKGTPLEHAAFHLFNGFTNGWPSADGVTFVLVPPGFHHNMPLIEASVNLADSDSVDWAIHDGDGFTPFHTAAEAYAAATADMQTTPAEMKATRSDTTATNAYLLEFADGENGAWRAFEVRPDSFYCDRGCFDGGLLEMCDGKGPACEEYPDALMSDYSDWDFRLGVEMPQDGGDCEGVADEEALGREGVRYRIRRVKLSGRLSPACAEWCKANGVTITFGKEV